MKFKDPFRLLHVTLTNDKDEWLKYNFYRVLFAEKRLHLQDSGEGGALDVKAYHWDKKLYSDHVVLSGRHCYDDTATALKRQYKWYEQFKDGRTLLLYLTPIKEGLLNIQLFQVFFAKQVLYQAGEWQGDEYTAEDKRQEFGIFSSHTIINRHANFHQYCQSLSKEFHWWLVF
jgi:hypothetical protein